MPQPPELPAPPPGVAGVFPEPPPTPPLALAVGVPLIEDVAPQPPTPPLLEGKGDVAPGSPPAPVAPPPPPPETVEFCVEVPLPPSFPCGGFTGGVLPFPLALEGPQAAPPAPDPPLPEAGAL